MLWLLVLVLFELLSLLLLLVYIVFINIIINDIIIGVTYKWISWDKDGPRERFVVGRRGGDSARCCNKVEQRWYCR